MLGAGLAYRCYMTTAGLDALRERQMAAKEKPRYDGTWRPEPGKVLPPVPDGVAGDPLRNPAGGAVVWDDKVKGRVAIDNDELDDLVIAPAAGRHADLQLLRRRRRHRHGITHVIRGDDHVNNTPRQINILRALGATPPVYAPADRAQREGEKMSKRHGAKPSRSTATRATSPTPSSTTSRAWAGAMATTDLQRGRSWCSGSTWITSGAAPVSSTRPSCAGSTPSTSSSRPTRPWHRWSPIRWRAWNCRRWTQGACRRRCGLFKDRCATTREIADGWRCTCAGAAGAADLAAHVTDAVAPALDTLQGRLPAWPSGAASAIARDQRRRWPRTL